MKTNYSGINYAGNLNINIDNRTRIRYGVIPVREVLQVWSDYSQPEYVSLICPKCGGQTDENSKKQIWKCRSCSSIYYDVDALVGSSEPIGWFVEDEDYEAYQDGEDIIILRSPFYTYAQFCSPCAPGMCYLLNPLTEPIEDNKCYCVGIDWFDDFNPPYDIYDVKTGELLYRAK